jgi:hypothetical protein
MEIYAIIQNGLVINTIEYAEQPSNPPPSFEEGVIAVLANGAGVGYTYANGVFTAPQPYPSWTLVDNIWQPPTPKPTESGFFIWNEDSKSWVKIQ